MTIDINNRMTMVRGDTESFSVAWPENPFESGDTVHLTVAKTYADNPALHIAVDSFTQGVALFQISHNDTANMDIGEYAYDVRVVRGDGSYTTIIGGRKNSPAVFVLTPEVTH